MSRLGRGFPNNALMRIPHRNAPPPVFDAESSYGAPGTVNSTPSWTHTATAGAYVVVDLYNDRATTFTCTYGGAAMTLLSSVSLPAGQSGNAVQYRFGISNAPSGAQTIASTGGARSAGGAVSYLNVASVGTSTTATGTASPSQSVTCAANQIAIQALSGYRNSATVALTPSGGTNRYNQSGNDCGLVTSDSTGPTTTFSASGTVSAWGGIATVLNG